MDEQIRKEPYCSHSQLCALCSSLQYTHHRHTGRSRNCILVCLVPVHVCTGTGTTCQLMKPDLKAQCFPPVIVIMMMCLGPGSPGANFYLIDI